MFCRLMHGEGVALRTALNTLLAAAAEQLLCSNSLVMGSSFVQAGTAFGQQLLGCSVGSGLILR
jgi:hypothetical protein